MCVLKPCLLFTTDGFGKDPKAVARPLDQLIKNELSDHKNAEKEQHVYRSLCQKNPVQLETSVLCVLPFHQVN